MSFTGLIFIGGFLMGCLLALARHPIFGLMTYVSVFYLHPPARWWGQSWPDLRWSLVAGAVTLVAVLMHQSKAKRPPAISHGILVGLIAFVAWIAIQSLWALAPDLHLELLVLFVKYVVLVWLMYACLDSEENLRRFLWTHVAGCFYLGWLVYSSYKGGRFEGFGSPNIDEANAGALQITTGVFAAAGLFLAMRWKARAALVGMMPFIVNALVATLSRSGFLAAAVGGFFFNLFTPPRYKWRVMGLSVLGIVLFFGLTNQQYWERLSTLKVAGEDIVGVDTGGGRLEIIAAQWRMFAAHPLGCGHRCTAVLSSQYLDRRFLSGTDDDAARSSHNTFMTMAVEQGIPGIVMYLAFLLWILVVVTRVRRRLKNQDGFLANMFPAVAAILIATAVGDMFVDYLKMEVRLWFIAVLMAMQTLALRQEKTAEASADSRAATKAGRLRPEPGARREPV